MSLSRILTPSRNDNFGINIDINTLQIWVVFRDLWKHIDNELTLTSKLQCINAQIIFNVGIELKLYKPSNLPIHLAGQNRHWHLVQNRRGRPSENAFLKPASSKNWSWDYFTFCVHIRTPYTKNKDKAENHFHASEYILRGRKTSFHSCEL